MPPKPNLMIDKEYLTCSLREYWLGESVRDDCGPEHGFNRSTMGWPFQTISRPEERQWKHTSLLVNAR